MVEWLLGVAVVGWLVYAATREQAQPLLRKIRCHVEVVEDDTAVEVIVENGYGVDITVSLDWLRTDGLWCETPLPDRLVVGGHEVMCAARLLKVRAQHVISVDWSWVWGSAEARPDVRYAYELPFEGTFPVTQGPGGRFSHQGDSRHAVDFGLPEGTPVLAARAGLVVDVESDYRWSGLNREIGGNYVLVRHDDGTVAEYFHLRRGGVAVEPGMEVEPGDLLGYSGNTGYSGGPHLHFMVFKATDGRRRMSLPLRFWVEGSAEPVTLREGAFYTPRLTV